MSKMVSWLKKIFSKKDKKQTTGRDKNMWVSTTTVVAIKFGTGVVLGVDGRLLATEFGRVAKNSSKKTLRAGLNGIGYSGNIHVLKRVKRRVKRDLAGREDIPFAEVVSSVKTHMEKYATKYENIAFDVLVVGKSSNDTWSIVELKVDSEKRMVSEREVTERYAAVGSGMVYVKKFLTKPKLTRDYPPNSAVAKRVELAFGALKHAVTKDYGTGGKLHVLSFFDADAEAGLKGGFDEFFEIQPNGPDYCLSKYEPYEYEKWEK